MALNPPPSSHPRLEADTTPAKPAGPSAAPPLEAQGSGTFVPNPIPEELLNPGVYLDPQKRLRAYAGGVPAFIRRARFLEDCLEAFWKRAAELHQRLKAECPSPSAFRQRWQAAVQVLDYAPLQRLVRDFNAYYPIEANLPINPVDGGYLSRGQPFKPAVAPGPEDVLARFPLE